MPDGQNTRGSILVKNWMYVRPAYSVMPWVLDFLREYQVLTLQKCQHLMTLMC